MFSVVFNNLTYYWINSYQTSFQLLFERQNENGAINLQKNQKSTKEHISEKFVSCYLHKFSNIGTTTHCSQMSKVDAGHVDFLIRTNLIEL
jgi:hypothetical protein